MGMDLRSGWKQFVSCSAYAVSEPVSLSLICFSTLWKALPCCQRSVSSVGFVH